MIGVGFKRNGKIKLEVSYDDSELEVAIAMGESLARHNRGEVYVFLVTKGKPKVKVLKRIRRARSGFLGIGRKVVVV